MNRIRKSKFIATTFNPTTFDDPVPSEPNQEISKHLDTISPQFITTIKEIFESRPIWSRLAILNTVPKELSSSVTLAQILPMVAYVVVNGPWRDCWIRYIVINK